MGGSSLPASPAVGEPRNALLDAIRGAGGVSSLRSTPVESRKDRSSPLSDAAASGAGGAAGGDLATSLLAALNDRKKAIQSDDDSDSDDGSEWDD
jgi:Wiskott-Aldrich syndrome protein